MVKNQHLPRIILENFDKVRLARARPIKRFRIWKILKGDLVSFRFLSCFFVRFLIFYVQVQVMEGKSAGERGKVIAVDRKKNTVLVDQVNLVCFFFFFFWTLLQIIN